MAAKKNATPPATPPPQEIPLGPDHPLVLTALREDNPRDFLAALGLLRLLAVIDPQQGPRLSWSSGNPVFSWNDACHEWHASRLRDLIRELVTFCTFDEAIATLVRKLISDEYCAPAFRPVRDNTLVSNLVFWPVASAQKYENGMNILQTVFRNAVGSLIRDDASKESSKVAELQLRMLSALASQVHENSDKKRNVQKCNMSMFSFANKQGQKYLLYGVQKAALELTETDVSEFLAGRCLPVVCDTFRWSPDEYRPSAYAGSNSDFLDVALVNILAFFGLSFYPVVERMWSEETLGMSSHRTNGRTTDHFSWPLWTTPAPVDVVFSMLHHPTVHGERVDFQQLAAQGVTAVWRSMRFSADKSLYFSPAARVF